VDEFEDFVYRKKLRIDGSNFVGRIEIVRDEESHCFFVSRMNNILKRREKENLSKLCNEKAL
jgi:hypothetical protein